MNRKQWWSFAAVFFCIGLLSFFARALFYSGNFVFEYHLYNVLTWIFIGLAFAFAFSGSFEKESKIDLSKTELEEALRKRGYVQFSPSDIKKVKEKGNRK